jgi:hypothetical protein
MIAAFQISLFSVVKATSIELRSSSETIRSPISLGAVFRGRR